MVTDSPPAALSDESETSRLVRLAAGGDQQAWTLLLARHRDRLSRMVAVRMDRRLQGRIDPSDVIQEACVVAAKQISAYAVNPTMPFYLWLRWITGQRLIEQTRRHLGSRRGAPTAKSRFSAASFPKPRAPTWRRSSWGILPAPVRMQFASNRRVSRVEVPAPSFIETPKLIRHLRGRR
jgi:RNA polymerase sigma-70 factor (ECF subfamily)